MVSINVEDCAVLRTIDREEALLKMSPMGRHQPQTAITTTTDIESGQALNNVDADIVLRNARLLFGHGWLQLFFGCLGGLLPLAGVALPPVVGAMHKMGVIQGAALLGAGAGWRLLPLDPLAQRVTVATLLLPLWSNLLGGYVAAIAGASGNIFDPSFDDFLRNADATVNLVTAALLNASLLVLVPFGTAALASLFPAFCKRLGPALGRAEAALAVCAILLAVVLTVALPHVNPALGAASANGKVAAASVHGSNRVTLCPFAFKPA